MSVPEEKNKAAALFMKRNHGPKYIISDRCLFGLLRLSKKNRARFIENLRTFLPVFRELGISVIPHFENEDDDDFEDEPSTIQGTEAVQGYE